MVMRGGRPLGQLLVMPSKRAASRPSSTIDCIPTAARATLDGMLREVKTARWTRRVTLLGRRYELRAGNAVLAACRSAPWHTLAARQAEEPTPIAEHDGRRYWWFELAIYWEDDDLDVHDVLALVRDRERRRRRRLERAHAALAADTDADATGQPRRQLIPRELRLAVFQRDGGRCAECGSSFDLQYDHVIPVALGGATTLANLQLLCSACNQRKGAALA